MRYQTDHRCDHIHLQVRDAGGEEEREQQQQLEGLLASAANMLPAAQQGLATTPPQTPGPTLALARGTAARQVCSAVLQ